MSLLRFTLLQYEEVIYGVSYEETPKCVSSETTDYFSTHLVTLRYTWDASFNVQTYEEQIKRFNSREFERLADTMGRLEGIDDCG